MNVSALLKGWRKPAVPGLKPGEVASAARSHVGLKRRVNEDRTLDCSWYGLWAVADGMGGHSAGDVAAETAVRALRDCAEHATPLDQEAIRGALAGANQAIGRLGAGRDAVSGSTIVVLHVAGGEATILWAGDSRAYRWRDGQLAQLTRDHSLVQSLVDAGAVAPEDAEHHPHANVVTRALGVAANAAVDVVSTEVRSGDLFLLCSDGLSKALPATELARLMARGTIEAAADALLAEALVRDGSDNISLVLVRAG